MGPSVGRGKKGSGSGIRDIKRGLKTKARTKDLDQIFQDVKNKLKLETLAPIDPDLPGFGQNYCTECARHFISSQAKIVHLATKAHKRRVKTLATEKPYSIKEAEAGGGLMS